jgi:hypothetical protein
MGIIVKQLMKQDPAVLSTGVHCTPPAQADLCFGCALAVQGTLHAGAEPTANNGTKLWTAVLVMVCGYTTQAHWPSAVNIYVTSMLRVLAVTRATTGVSGTLATLNIACSSRSCLSKIQHCQPASLA